LWDEEGVLCADAAGVLQETLCVLIHGDVVLIHSGCIDALLTDPVTRTGIPYVINNNWIVGNAAKITRAKRWGHWFVQDERSGTCQDAARLQQSLNAMRASIASSKPPHGPPRADECPKC